MKHTLQTGDTQAICIEKPDSFIDWCIGVTDSALEKRVLNVEQVERVPAKLKAKPKKRKAA